MKTLAPIFALLAASGVIVALPHGDQKGTPDVKDDVENLRAAIELLSSIEYQQSEAPVKRSPLEESTLRAAIELLSDREHRDGGGDYPGPFYEKPAKRSKISAEEEQGLRAAIELISKYEYNGLPGRPRLPAKLHARKTLSVEEEKAVRAAIELLSKYEYDGRVVPPFPRKPHPRPGPVYNIPRALPKEEEASLRAAIELLTNYEYKSDRSKTLKRSPAEYQNGRPISRPPPGNYPVPGSNPLPGSPGTNNPNYQVPAIPGIPNVNNPIPNYPIPIPPIIPGTSNPIPGNPGNPAPGPNDPISNYPIPTIPGGSNPVPVYPIPGLPGSTSPNPNNLIPLPKPQPNSYTPTSPPAYVPPRPYYKRAEPSEEADREILRAAIELISKYEYKDGSNPVPLPYIPIKTLKPIPLPAPNYKPVPLPNPNPGPYKPVDPRPPIYQPLPVKEYEKREEVDKEDLKAAIELISKFDYRPRPIKPVRPPFTIKPYPVATLKPVAPPLYDPAPAYRPVLGREALKEEQTSRYRS